MRGCKGARNGTSQGLEVSPYQTLIKYKGKKRNLTVEKFLAHAIFVKMTVTTTSHGTENYQVPPTRLQGREHGTCVCYPGLIMKKRWTNTNSGTFYKMTGLDSKSIKVLKFKGRLRGWLRRRVTRDTRQRVQCVIPNWNLGSKRRDWGSQLVKLG